MKVEKVQCIDCHSGVAAKKKETFDAIKKRCVECLDQSYGDMAVQWKTTSEQLLKKTAQKMAEVKAEIDRIELRGGHTFVYRKLYGDAEVNFNLAKRGNGIHNLEYMKDLLGYADSRLNAALKQLAKSKQEISKGRIF